MFHLANCVEFLRDKNSGAPLSSLSNHFVVAQRRAFSFARYLVEEHSVTSPRVLKAAADIIVQQTTRALSNKESKSTKNEQDNQEQEEELSDEDRHQENLNMAASFATIILISALKRSAVTEKQLEEQNAKNKSVSGVNLMLQQWGRYVAQKFSSSSWWEKFGPENSQQQKSNIEAIHHHSLEEGVEELCKALIAVKKEMPSLAEDYSCFV